MKPSKKLCRINPLPTRKWPYWNSVKLGNELAVEDLPRHGKGKRRSVRVKLAKSKKKTKNKTKQKKKEVAERPAATFGGRSNERKRTKKKRTRWRPCRRGGKWLGWGRRSDAQEREGNLDGHWPASRHRPMAEPLNRLGNSAHRSIDRLRSRYHTQQLRQLPLFRFFCFLSFLLSFFRWFVFFFFAFGRWRIVLRAERARSFCVVRISLASSSFLIFWVFSRFIFRVPNRFIGGLPSRVADFDKKNKKTNKTTKSTLVSLARPSLLNCSALFRQ